MKKRLVLTTALLLGVAGVSRAQQDYDNDAQGQRGQRPQQRQQAPRADQRFQQGQAQQRQGQAQQRQGQMGQTQEVQGTILRSKQVDLRGSDRKELIVLIRTEDGRRLTVDLGPTASWKRQEIRTGDTVHVRGKTQRVGDFNVLMASQLWSDDQDNWVRINRPAMQQAARGQGQGQGRGHQMEAQTRSLTGTVQSTRQVRLRDAQNRHLVALIQTQGGRNQVVDLGPAQRLRDRIQEGDRVTVQGRNFMIDERPVLLAFSLTSDDGETIRIDRGQAGMQAPRQAGQRQGQQRQMYGTDRQGTSRDQGQFRQGMQHGERQTWQGQRQSYGMEGQERDQEGFEDQEFRTPTGLQGRQGQQDRSGRQNLGGQQGSRQGVKNVRMSAESMEFSPSVITAHPGQQIRLILNNEGEARHSIEFELPSGEVSLQQAIQPGQARGLEFTAPQQPGTYTFYCPVGNHREQGMVGQLIVRPAE